MTLVFPGDKRLQTLQNKTGGGVNISKLDYTYDPAGRTLSVTDQIDATDPDKATGTRGANPYDAASQLTSWQTKDTITGTQISNYPYSYDASGNRTADALDPTYVNSILNEMTSRTDFGGTTYPTGYDFNGNRTSEPGVTYEWNAADELSAYNFGNYRYEFSYNGDGHLWQAVKKVGGVVQNTYRYLWIGDQVREQRDSTWTTVLQKYWHNGTIINNGTQLLALRDQLGSVRELINDNSTLTIRARYRYPEPYGGFPVKVSGDLDSPFQFAGYFIEPFSGLIFTGHRVYVAAQGRWLNRDPLAEQGGLNLYGYVGNSPVNGIDPAGLDYFYLNDTQAVNIMGVKNGHAASLVGDPITGYDYYSKDGAPPAKNVTAHFDTLDDFENDPLSSRYDRGIQFPTTPADDQLMRNYANTNYTSKFDGVTNNCADLSKGIMNAGGIKPGGKFLGIVSRPNSLYNTLKSYPTAIPFRLMP